MIVADPLYDVDRSADVAGASADVRLTAARHRALRAYGGARQIAMFSPLPGTRREAAAVARALGVPPDSSDLRVGAAAVEHGIKSLQRAKAELRADRRFTHPFYWAAFLRYGVE